MRKFYGVAVAVVMTAAMGPELVMGQEPQVSSSTQMSANSVGIAAILEAVSGQPYEAEKMTKSVQKLWDGTVITHEDKSMIARDSEGRVREDVYTIHSGSLGGKQQNNELQMTTVSDPVEHTVTIWHSDGLKTAIEMRMPSIPKLPKGLPGGIAGGVMGSGGALGQAPTPVKLKTPGQAQGPADEVKTEDLGTQSLEGVLVTLKRVTTVIPMGKIGNDRPITIVHEEWGSADLKTVVKSFDSDPRTGERTMELRNLSRADPDIALFRVPDGYKVTDMAEMMKKLGDLGRVPTK